MGGEIRKKFFHYPPTFKEGFFFSIPLLRGKGGIFFFHVWGPGGGAIFRYFFNFKIFLQAFFLGQREEILFL